MSILNINNSIGIDIGDVEAAKGYNGEMGICRMALESTQNEMLLFNSFLQNDITEYRRIHEGASDEEIMSIRENAFTDALDKILQFLKKVWEKIKGIFESVIAKFTSIFMKDNKEFYNKYINTINKSTKSFEKFKAKYSAPKDFFIHNMVAESIDKIDFPKKIEFDSSKNYKDLLENWDGDDEYEKALNKVFNSNYSKKTFKKEFHDDCFDTEEVPDWTKDKVTTAIRVLSEKSIIDKLKQSKTKAENNIKKMITAIEKSKRDLLKVKSTTDPTTKNTTHDTSGIRTNFKSGEQDAANTSTNLNSKTASNDDFNNLSRYLDHAQKLATTYNTIITDICNAIITEVKFAYSQARRIMASAVSYVNLQKESYSVDDIDDLLVAVGEASEFDFNTEFEEEDI